MSCLKSPPKRKKTISFKQFLMIHRICYYRDSTLLWLKSLPSSGNRRIFTVSCSTLGFTELFWEDSLEEKKHIDLTELNPKSAQNRNFRCKKSFKKINPFGVHQKNKYFEALELQALREECHKQFAPLQSADESDLCLPRPPGEKSGRSKWGQTKNDGKEKQKKWLVIDLI